MMQLYTVILQQPKMVSRFDHRGKLISDTTEYVQLTIRDLPYQTAKMYQTTDSQGTCEIIAQERSLEAFGRKTSFKFDRKPIATEKKATAKTSAPKVDKHAAARTGDMSAAINRGA